MENRQTERPDQILSEQTILVGDVILTEIPQSFDSDKDFKVTKQVLGPLYCVHLGGNAFAIKAASNFRFLRSKGVAICKTVDVLIGNDVWNATLNCYTTTKTSTKKQNSFP